MPKTFSANFALSALQGTGLGEAIGAGLGCLWLWRAGLIELNWGRTEPQGISCIRKVFPDRNGTQSFAGSPTAFPE